MVLEETILSKVTQSQNTNMVCTHSYADFRHRVRITSLQSTLPKKLINKEVPKRDVHGPLEKGRGSRSAEQIGSKGREGRVLGEWEGEKKRDSNDMREQKVQVRGRIHDNKTRHIIIEGNIFGLQRNQALGNCLEIHKDDTANYLSNRGEATSNTLPWLRDWLQTYMLSSSSRWK